MSGDGPTALLPIDEVSTADALAHIERETRRFVEVAARSPGAAHVPAYPAFTTETLAAHIGRALRTFDAAASSGEYDAAQTIAAPTGSAVVEWVSSALDPLITTLTDISPDVLVPLPHGADALPARRIAPLLAVEVSVHRWDLESVLAEHAPTPAQLAVLQIDVVFANFVPRLAASGVPSIGGSVQLAATDAPVRWALSVDDGCLVAGRAADNDPDADVVVSGPAQDLALLVWKRVPLPLLDLKISGSVAVVNRLLSVNYIPDPRTTGAH
jgi:uncharacterized protein (TIGR03083 family)